MTSALKNLIASKKISKTDKVLLILSTQNIPVQLAGIRDTALKLGFREIKTMNINAHLNGSGGKAILLPDGWELTDDGKKYLSTKGYLDDVTPLAPLLGKVDQYVSGIQSKEVTEFLREAIECANRKLYRAAVVLSWVGAVSVLHKHVFTSYLSDFNNEATSRGLIKKPIKVQDGFSKVGENDFLQVLESISVISSDVKKELLICLGRRNSCGHPNNIRFSEPTVASHLESLILYVFSKFKA